METIPISKFKATCLSLLDRVKNTGESILVTKRGVPIAKVVPPPKSPKKKGWFGCMAGTAKVKGDIISPLPIDEWKVLK